MTLLIAHSTSELELIYPRADGYDDGYDDDWTTEQNKLKEVEKEEKRIIAALRVQNTIAITAIDLDY